MRADEAAPDLAANFRLDEGGVSLAADSRFLGRVLGPRETVELNRLYLAASDSPFQALEDYGEAMAKFSARPARRGATSLWCSWYAHRMGMGKSWRRDATPKCADHHNSTGWQRGDITGDWVTNERFHTD